MMLLLKTVGILRCCGGACVCGSKGLRYSGGKGGGGVAPWRWGREGGGGAGGGGCSRKCNKLILKD
jgi:hypothetical protein